MATKKSSKKHKDKLVVGSDPPIVITGGGGGPFPFPPSTVTNQIEVEFTDAAGRKVKFKPKHGGVSITHVVVSVDVVKGGVPMGSQLVFDSQAGYTIGIQFFTDTLKKAISSASAKKGSKKRAGR